jgi:hypothetical protein
MSINKVSGAQLLKTSADHLHNERWHGGAVPETVLKPTLEQGGGGG